MGFKESVYVRERGGGDRSVWEGGVVTWVFGKGATEWSCGVRQRWRSFSRTLHSHGLRQADRDEEGGGVVS